MPIVRRLDQLVRLVLQPPRHDEVRLHVLAKRGHGAIGVAAGRRHVGPAEGVALQLNFTVARRLLRRLRIIEAVVRRRHRRVAARRQWREKKKQEYTTYTYEGIPRFVHMNDSF